MMKFASMAEMATLMKNTGASTLGGLVQKRAERVGGDVGPVEATGLIVLTVAEVAARRSRSPLTRLGIVRPDKVDDLFKR